MSSFVETTKRWYLVEIAILDQFKHAFVLILRLYFGWGFISAGTGKLFNVSTQATFFADYGIPFPVFNVYMAGTTETVCGFLLLIGTVSRIITIPLIVTMLVAYATAHTDQFKAFWGNTPIFFKAPPFPYLLVSIIVLLFGPGRYSVDACVKWYLEKRETRPNANAAVSPGAVAPVAK